MGVDLYTLKPRTLKVRIPGVADPADVHLMTYAVKLGGMYKDDDVAARAEDRAYGVMKARKSNYFVVCGDEVESGDHLYEGLIPLWSDCDPVPAKLIGFFDEKKNGVWSIKDKSDWIVFDSGLKIRDVIVDGKCVREEKRS